MTIDLEDLFVFLLFAAIGAAMIAFYLLIGAAIADFFDADGPIFYLLTLAWPFAIAVAVQLAGIAIAGIIALSVGVIGGVVRIINAIKGDS